jgi:hypothetical protein
MARKKKTMEDSVGELARLDKSINHYASRAVGYLLLVLAAQPAAVTTRLEHLRDARYCLKRAFEDLGEQDG